MDFWKDFNSTLVIKNLKLELEQIRAYHLLWLINSAIAAPQDAPPAVSVPTSKHSIDLSIKILIKYWTYTCSSDRMWEIQYLYNLFWAPYTVIYALEPKRILSCFPRFTVSESMRSEATGVSTLHYNTNSARESSLHNSALPVAVLVFLVSDRDNVTWLTDAFSQNLHCTALYCNSPVSTWGTTLTHNCRVQLKNDTIAVGLSIQHYILLNILSQSTSQQKYFRSVGAPRKVHPIVVFIYTVQKTKRNVQAMQEDEDSI